jgi:predicted TIM-barrel fold metal-dependent hydrolase
MEPRLRVVMLHGGAAHKVWDWLAKHHPRVTRRYSPVRTYHTARTTFRSKDPAVREYRRQNLRDAFARAAAEL